VNLFQVAWRRHLAGGFAASRVMGEPAGKILAPLDRVQISRAVHSIAGESCV